MKNQPAFPVSFKWNEELSEYNGMTLRDYFAAKAMQGEMTQGIHEVDFAETAARSYAMADAMLKAREA
jgi:hypothetical protein